MKFLDKLHKYGLKKFLKLCVAAIRGYLQFGSLVLIHGPIRTPRNYGDITLGKLVRIFPNVRLSCIGTEDRRARILIGDHSSIGDRTEIHAGKQVIIGKHVGISWDCIIMDRDYHSRNGHLEVLKPVLIEDDVLIGCRSIILKGVRIGKGAIVGAGSIVTKDVEPYTMVAGNPARLIGKL